MKRLITFLLFVALLFALCGCVRPTGYMEYTGTYVKTSQGEHILIHTAEGREEYFILQQTASCSSLEKLKTGDIITIQTACLAYDEAEISERKVYDWKRKLFGRTEISQTVLDHIEDLLNGYSD